MSKPTNGRSGQAKNTDRAQATTKANPDDAGIDVLIEQAEAVRTSLRDSLSKTGELVSGLKRHRKESKALASALASLKRLQAVDA